VALIVRYLADLPEAAPALAAWFAREWGEGKADRSEAAFASQLASYAQRDRLPICLVGVLGDEPVATASLKFREIEYRPEADFWLGWVCVREDMRGRGLGSLLVAAAEAEALSRRLSPLYLHTPSRETFYSRLGWKTLGTTIADGAPSIVMAKALG